MIEGQVSLLLARISEIRVPETDRRALRPSDKAPPELDPFGLADFLGTVRPDTLQVSAGVATYPRIGDRVFSAPHDFIARIPELLDPRSDRATPKVLLNLGTVSGNPHATIEVLPERLFGRHCAVLGATGGGKSWTVARVVEQCAAHHAKVLLLDATGEYRSTTIPNARHHHLGVPRHAAPGSIECSLPPTNFTDSDFVAMFEPSGKVQGPKLREAMLSLRLIHADNALADPNGTLTKKNTQKQKYEQALKKHVTAVEHATAPFDVSRLANQVLHECVYPDGGDRSNPDPLRWGGINESDRAYCYGLAARIAAIVKSTSFRPVFQTSSSPSFSVSLREFLLAPHQSLMRVCLSGVSYEYRAREFIVNAIGRALMTSARDHAFYERPLLVVVDEAHNFLGRTIGSDDNAVRLDAFELIAREGRKYGLNVCLATQRPRDLTEGVLSQIGTLIVHRLTNDRDREVVERACGAIDRSAAAFLANLRQGEAAIIGVDFPIPLTVAVGRPDAAPMSDGPNYQHAWRKSADEAEAAAPASASTTTCGPAPT